MMIYELYCGGHIKKFKTMDGYIKRSIHFCSGCRKRQIGGFFNDPKVSKVICEFTTKDSTCI